jgi:hypothetical protein
MVLSERGGCPYMLQRATLVILSEYLRGLDVVDRFPSVIALRVPFPLDQILELPPPAVMTVVSNRLDFVLFLIIDKVRRGSREVLPILLRFLEGHEERGVEDGVDGPLRGQA